MSNHEDRTNDGAGTHAELEHGDASAVDDGDLNDMLGELRVLLPSAQLLSAFLITVPFNTGFANIVTSEKRVFLATFILAITSLVLLSSPAVQHRLIRPLRDRARFKLATRQIVAGSMALSLALILATQLVLSEVFGHVVGIFLAAGFVATLILLLWWIMPKILKRSGRL